jgi:hypothetical protein
MRNLKLILFRILVPFNEVRSCHWWKDALGFLTPFQLYADVPSSLLDHNGNRCHADTPLSGGLSPPAPPKCTTIGTSFLFPAHGSRCSFSTLEGNQHSGLKTSATKQTYNSPAPLSRMEVAVHTTFERTWPSQMSDHDSGTSITEQVHEKPDIPGPDGNIKYTV